MPNIKCENCGRTITYCAIDTPQCDCNMPDFTVKKIEIPDVGNNRLAFSLYMSISSQIHLLQGFRDIMALYDYIVELNPRIIVEIGVNEGGTMWLWKLITDKLKSTKKRYFFGIDINLMQIKIPPDTIPNLTLIESDSMAYNLKYKIFQMLGSRDVDFCFIDGNHDYDYVKNDFELIWPFIRQGGMVALHDTKQFPDVGKYFDSLKGKKVKIDIDYGIGIIYKD